MVRSVLQRHGASFLRIVVLTLTAHYLAIRHLHVACVALSSQ